MSYQIYTFRKTLQPSTVDKDDMVIDAIQNLFLTVSEHMRYVAGQVVLENVNRLMQYKPEVKEQWLQILNNKIENFTNVLQPIELEHFNYQITDFKFLSINPAGSRHTKIEITLESGSITILNQVENSFVAASGDQSKAIQEGKLIEEIFLLQFPIKDIHTFKSIPA